MPISTTHYRFATALAVCMASNLALAQDEMDDILGGFDDPVFEEATEIADSSEEEAKAKQFLGWDFNGSLSSGVAWNIHEHQSSTGTDYSGLSKLRFRSNIGLDRKFQVSESKTWQATFNAYAWYDASYDLHDREYTDEVEDEYRWDADIQDAYLQGRLSSSWDIRIGRQVVVWGFSDNLRVLDQLNPLDNLEIGLADIEDLRRPTGMVKLDHFRDIAGKPWQISLIAIPELRFSRLPAFGSDFYNITDTQGQAVQFRTETPDDFERINWAIRAKGEVAGLDLSLIAARLWQDTPYLDVSNINSNNFPAALATFNDDAFLAFSRISSFGFGIQKVVGSWLLKQEAVALIKPTLVETNLFAIPGGQVAVPSNNIDRRQYHGLLGLEYFGIASTNISLDLAVRIIDEFTDGLARSGLHKQRNEAAVRITRDFLNERLRVNLIALHLDDSGNVLGKDGGALYRLNASYELSDGLEISGGTVLYQAGNQPSFANFDDNDRVFADVKWSF